MNIFVSLDGVDGVGKTTIAKLLTSDGSFVYFKSPSGIFQQLRSEVDSIANPLGRYCFYRLATQSDSTQIKGLLEKHSVICDRYIASTFAYHVAMDPCIRNIHDEFGILRPDFSFLLLARTEIRNQRIQNRATVKSDRMIEQNSDFLDRVNNCFLTLGLVSIDTSDKKPLDVANAIMEIIGKGKIHEP